MVAARPAARRPALVHQEPLEDLHGSNRLMHIARTRKGHRAAAMTLLALETLPCGCVAGVYQARPTVVEVEFVEAKGPHCVFSRHRAGQVTRLGVPEAMVSDTGEPLV